MRIVLIFIFCILSFFSNSQTYFHPNNSSNWDAIPSTDFNWCQEKIDSLYSFLDATNSKSFILLKNGQIINIVPSMDLVLIRMGQSPDSSLVPMNFVNELWDYLNDLPCNTTNINQEVNKNSKELDKVIDFLGRETSKKNNIPLIYMYKNGTGEKKIFID